MKPALVLSCEHGGNRVPERYREVFAGAARDLASHRGSDVGALVLARDLARALDAPLFACTTTRLLVDASRSLGHRQLFSRWSRGLEREEREAVLERWWAPHRAGVEAFVRSQMRERRTVLHVSVHSFTPTWNGRRRAVDVGLLYDPSHRRERDFATEWLRSLRRRRPDLRLRRNEPYRGTADGLTTFLRGRFDERRYLGIELEVSQRFPLGPPAPWRALRGELRDSLEEAAARFDGPRRDGPPDRDAAG